MTVFIPVRSSDLVWIDGNKDMMMMIELCCGDSGCMWHHQVMAKTYHK
jgi:hypothetical protein